MAQGSGHLPPLPCYEHLTLFSSTSGPVFCNRLVWHTRDISTIFIPVHHSPIFLSTFIWHVEYLMFCQNLVPCVESTELEQGACCVRLDVYQYHRIWNTEIRQVKIHTLTRYEAKRVYPGVLSCPTLLCHAVLLHHQYKPATNHTKISRTYTGASMGTTHHWQQKQHNQMVW